MEITGIIILALFVEAIIQAVKPLWERNGTALSVTEIVSMALGVVIAVLFKINLLSGLIEPTSIILCYLLYVLTGIALGRGPSFVHDLWTKLRAYVVKGE